MYKEYLQKLENLKDKELKNTELKAEKIEKVDLEKYDFKGYMEEYDKSFTNYRTDYRKNINQ